MRALIVEDSLPRLAATKTLSKLTPRAFVEPTSPMQLREIPDPTLAAPDCAVAKTRPCLQNPSRSRSTPSAVRRLHPGARCGSTAAAPWAIGPRGIEEYEGRRMHAMEWYFGFLLANRIDVTPIITHGFPVARYRDALMTCHAQGDNAAVQVLFGDFGT